MAKPIVIVTCEWAMSDDDKAKVKHAMESAFGGKATALVAGGGMRIDVIRDSMHDALAKFGLGVLVGMVPGLIALVVR
jgi:hypothetical protein